jgi:hypothetical protein
MLRVIAAQHSVTPCGSRCDVFSFASVRIFSERMKGGYPVDTATRRSFRICALLSTRVCNRFYER